MGEELVMKQKGRKIHIFDTTLRDGEQSPGASLTPAEKLIVAQHLERLNVDVIEAGFPAASPGEVEAIQKISKQVKGPVICGLARMVKKDVEAVKKALKYAKKKRIHVFLATSQIHREHKLHKTKQELFDLTKKFVSECRKDFDEIEFSPEDACRTERKFLSDMVKTAIKAGATSINIPDTVGYTFPQEFQELIKYLIKNNPQLGKKVVLSVHCHNDLGLAVANSLSAIIAGANQVECTVNGIGERAGNASLEEIAMAIDTRKDVLNCHTDIKLGEITKASKAVSHLTGMMIQPNKAIVGRNAFSHESGIHQDGVLKMRQTYEIMDPKRIGLTGNELILGKHSGRHAFRDRLNLLGYDLSDEVLENVFERFKKLADKKKYVFDEDLERLIEVEVTDVPTYWELVHLDTHVITDKTPKAKIKLRYKKKIKAGTSTGDGPVDACYRALEKITGIKVKLLDYAINSVTSGKDAMGEVRVKLRIKNKEVTGRGTSTDVIEASVQAYLRALNKIAAHMERKPSKSPYV